MYSERDKKPYSVELVSSESLFQWLTAIKHCREKCVGGGSKVFKNYKNSCERFDYISIYFLFILYFF